MKRRLYIMLVVLMTVVTGVQAQHPNGNNAGGNRASIAEFFKMKVDFIVKDIKLNAGDSARFVPLYSEYIKAKGELMHNAVNGRSIGRKLMRHENVSEKEFLDAANGELEYKVKEAELAKVWFAKFAKVLTPQQLFNLLRSEERFAADMMKRHERRGNGGPQGGQPRK